MKRSLLVLLSIAIILQSEVIAQGIFRASNNPFIKVNGTAVIKLSNTDLDISGNFSAGNGSVEFLGTGTGNISGAQPLVFNHLIINRPTVQLNQDIQVDGNLNFTSGMLELNGNNLTLGQPNGLLNETESSHIIGASGGEVIVTLSLNNPGQSNPGNIGVAITSAANLGVTTIRRGHTPLVLPALGNSVQRYFDLAPANNSNLNATLRFNYFQSELNGLAEANLNLFRLNGTVWETGSLLGMGMQTEDAAQNWVQTTGLSHSSVWRLAECPSISPAISGSATICPNSSIPLDAGSGFASYQWSTTQTTQVINVSAAGTYTVTVSDANGCTGTDSHIVTQDTALSPVITGASAFCPGGSTTLDAGAGFSSYLWSDNSTFQTLVVSVAGTYTVTVTDATSGCTGTDSEMVTQSLPASTTITGLDTICVGGSTTLDAGAGFSSYLWSDNSTLQTLVVNTAGTYSVTVTNATTGCTGTDSLVVIQHPPVLSAITGSATFCAGGSTTLDAGAGFGGYLWSTGAITRTISVNTAGTYTVTVTDANGCTGTASQTVMQSTGLSLNITGTTIFCPGGNTQLNGGSGFDDYIWSTGETEQIITVSVAGTYTVTVSNAGGCTGSAMVQVSTHPPITVTIDPPETLDCDTEQITLVATGTNLSFQWSTTNGNIVSGANTAQPTVDEGGVYQLVASNANCSEAFSISVVQTGVPISGMEVEVSDPTCYGQANGTLTITEVTNGTGPYQYALGAGGVFQSNNTFHQLQTGVYTVQVRGADGCTAQQSATLDAPDTLTVSISKPGLIQEGENVELEPMVSGGVGPFSYSWQGQTLSCDDCPAPLASPVFTSIYMLTLTDANGCTATASVVVEVNSRTGTDIITPGDDDGINDTLTFADLDVNPMKYAENDIVIFNRWGQVVYKAQPYRNEWKGENQTGQELPEGTYYYVLLLRDGVKNVIHGNVLIIR